MKKYALFLIILITVSCDKPDQFTSVEGYVTDYNTKEPVVGISLEITETMPWDPTYSSQGSDTVVTNDDGYYYYYFYYKEDRWYYIDNLPFQNYWYSGHKLISKGRSNTINFAIKRFKILTLNCYNQNNTFNWLRVSSYIYDQYYICNPCE
ncbi:MAG: hypothetical protein K9H26_09450 [Prolixibacteraceae bacterium]|nr:hypothetical protein [Prolixibacteraceae bacterium]